MNVSPINTASATANFAAMQALHADKLESGVNTSKSTNSGRDPAAIKKAASQFEAIILRQLLAPSIEPMMAGSLGGGQSSGGSVYGYMLTDTLANSLAQGGGLGLAHMLEKQLTPRGVAADNTANSRTSAYPQLKPFKQP
jgi:flagellar protein FlgJ